MHTHIHRRSLHVWSTLAGTHHKTFDASLTQDKGTFPTTLQTSYLIDHYTLNLWCNQSLDKVGKDCEARQREG